MNYCTIKRIILALCILFNLPILHAAPFVYVSNTGSTTVSVIDVASNTVIDTINLGLNAPQTIGIADTPDGKMVYVNCYDGTTGTVQRIAVATNTVLLPDIVIGVGILARGIVIDPNDLYAYITCGDGTVKRINIAMNSIDSSIAGFSDPTYITVAPNGLTVYVSDKGTNHVVPIDVNTNVASFPGASVTNPPQDLQVSPDNTYLYVADGVGSSVIQFNVTNPLAPTSPQSITTVTPNPFIPTSLVISPDGKTLYVATVGGPAGIVTFDISNPASPAFASYLATTHPGPIVITSDGTSLYAPDLQSNVFQINSSNRLNPTLTTTIPVGLKPFGLAITPLTLTPPSSISGCKTQNRFLLQTDFINNITWTAPTTGSPVSYNIYRDAALTQLVANVPASGTLQYFDHDRQPNVIYSYYITSVDSSGNQSTAASVTVTNPC